MHLSGGSSHLLHSDTPGNSVLGRMEADEEGVPFCADLVSMVAAHQAAHELVVQADRLRPSSGQQ